MRPPAPAVKPTQRKAVKPPKGKAVPRRLVVTAGGLTGTSMNLGDQIITIGRADDSTLVLTDDYASARHARLVPQDGQWLVEDLGSTNGTYLDRDKVDRAHARAARRGHPHRQDRDRAAPMTGLRFAARTDVGLLRDGNEDSIYAGPRLLAVADGMGGAAAGEVASAVAIAAIAPLDEDPPGARPARRADQRGVRGQRPAARR